MESVEATIAGSTAGGMIGADFSSQIGGEIHQLMSAAPPPETGSSFTALLELPANEAMELLVHSPAAAAENPSVPLAAAQFHECPLPPPAALAVFPSDAAALVDRASKFSGKLEIVKQEPLDSVSNPNSNSSPAVSNPAVDQNPKTTKRKDREKKVKESNKKSKQAANESSDDGGGEKLPYVHVRARRGQATDSHSLAERARREKINARMKLLQELVPGCNKISGTAMVLDEIINHVQSLQRQVEFLSMRLATVNPRVDFDIDALIATENGSPVEMGYPGMVVPAMWPEGQVHVNSQQYQQLWHMDELHQPVWVREEDNSNFFTPENSLLSYDSSGNSGKLGFDSITAASTSHSIFSSNWSTQFHLDYDKECHATGNSE